MDLPEIDRPQSRAGAIERILDLADTSFIRYSLRVDAHIDLARALETLTPDQRAVVALCLGAGLSHRETAEVLDLPLGTVKSHVERGRSKLMTLLGHPS